MSRASHERISGSLFGLALGDALGARTEFLNVAQILKRFPPHGPTEPEGDPALVTDDTQMALAVGEALVACLAEGSLSPVAVTRELSRTFVEWFRSPDNYRAPGKTCMLACQALEFGKPWIGATLIGSKGCGANMRVGPAAFAPPTQRAGISQLQAAITHGHPTGLAASDLTSLAIARLAAGCEPTRLLAELVDYVNAQLSREPELGYASDWLGELWTRSGQRTAAEFMRIGWEESLTALERLRVALRRPDPLADPCLTTGDGWIAEEALATGLHCFLLFPQEPIRALRRAAVTRGDSDSIAALTGAFAGASLGIGAWPREWIARIEYRERLEVLADRLAEFETWEPLSPGVSLSSAISADAPARPDPTCVAVQVGANQLQLALGDVTQERVEALVTAANRTLSGGNQAGFGGGVDGAIHRAAGPSLLEACREIGGCPAGEAVSTHAGALSFKRVIHAVGPVYGGHGGQEEALLAAAHRRSLEIAAGEACSSIAFPAISCGVYHYPVEEAAPIALSAICEFLKARSEVRLVRYCLFTRHDFDLFKSSLDDLVARDAALRPALV